MRKSPARLVAEAPRATFADVGGAAEARERLGDIVDFLRDPERWRATGARLPRGVLRIAYRPPFDEGYAALRLLFTP